jgi:hypothetical protein
VPGTELPVAKYASRKVRSRFRKEPSTRGFSLTTNFRDVATKPCLNYSTNVLICKGFGGKREYFKVSKEEVRFVEASIQGRTDITLLAEHLTVDQVVVLSPTVL